MINTNKQKNRFYWANIRKIYILKQTLGQTHQNLFLIFVAQYEKDNSMKINQLSLQNFRGFEHLEINFKNQVSVIIGTNGAGKSSVLDAIGIPIYDVITKLRKRFNGHESSLYESIKISLAILVSSFR